MVAQPLQLSLSIAIVTTASLLVLPRSVNTFVVLPTKQSKNVPLEYTAFTTNTLTTSAVEGRRTTDNIMLHAKKKLGLLTFDLDDTLYPIEPVVAEANAAFARTMENLGYTGILPSDIVEAGKRVREENPESAVTMTHTDVRRLAIRRKMVEFMYQNNLKEVAKDWGTDVASLSITVVVNARRWAETSVSESVVQAVLDSWEMERHHAAERHLYPEVIDVFTKIKEDNPGVIIGAVTDGKANPLLMTFTLAPFFNFCQSWEDDQAGRSKFFRELDSVEADADLHWIYDAAYDRFKDLYDSQNVDNNIDEGEEEEIVWIHVGDDLAYDVGGSASCGAKAIYCELDEKRYGQTARQRFDVLSRASQPSWSTNSLKELHNRKRLNDLAKEGDGTIAKTVKYLTLLPDALEEILEDDYKEEENILVHQQPHVVIA